MEAMARDQFAPLIMKVGAQSVDFIQTGDLTFSVVTKYADEATGIAAAQIQFSGCLIDLLISAQVQFGTALFFLKIGKYDYNLIILVAND